MVFVKIGSVRSEVARHCGADVTQQRGGIAKEVHGGNPETTGPRRRPLAIDRPIQRL